MRQGSPRAKKVCSAPGCPELCGRNGRGKYCDHHAHERKLAYYRRNPDAKKFTRNVPQVYGEKWRQVSRAFLQQNPICQAGNCQNRATIVHHIKPRRFGGTDAPSNLAALCAPCHPRVEAGRVTINREKVVDF